MSTCRAKSTRNFRRAPRSGAAATWAGVNTALPATVVIHAGGDIVVAGDATISGSKSFWLLPAEDGSLTMVAGEDISGVCTDPYGRRQYAALELGYQAPEYYYDYLRYWDGAVDAQAQRRRYGRPVRAIWITTCTAKTTSPWCSKPAAISAIFPWTA